MKSGLLIVIVFYVTISCIKLIIIKSKHTVDNQQNNSLLSLNESFISNLQTVSLKNTKCNISKRTVRLKQSDILLEDITDFIKFVERISGYSRFSIIIKYNDDNINNVVKICSNLYHYFWNKGMSVKIKSILNSNYLTNIIEKELLIMVFINFLPQIQEIQYLVSHIRPLYLITNWFTNDQLLKDLAKQVSINAELYVVNFSNNTMYEVYNIGSSINVNICGVKYNKEWIFSGQIKHVWLRRKKFSGTNLKGIFTREVIFDEQNPRYKKMFSFEKRLSRIWKIIMKSLNFSIVSVASRGDFGEQLENGSWTDSVGKLQRGEADIMINFVVWTASTDKAFTVKSNIITDSYRLIFRRTYLVHDVNKLFSPFTYNTWLATCVYIIFVLPIVLKIIFGRQVDFVMSFLIPIRCITFQGLGITPKNAAAYMGGLICLIFCYLISTLYKTSVVSSLTTSHFVFPFRSLEEYYINTAGYDLLIRKKDILATVIDIEKNDDNDLDSDLWHLSHGYKPPGGGKVIITESRDEVGRMLCKKGEKTVAFDLTYQLKDLIKCGFVISPVQYMKVPIGIASRNGLPVYPVINSFLLQMKEAGVLQHEMNYSPELIKSETPFTILTLKQMAPIFTIYFCAISFSLFVLLAECLFSFCNYKKGNLENNSIINKITTVRQRKVKKKNLKRDVDIIYKNNFCINYYN